MRLQISISVSIAIIFCAVCLAQNYSNNIQNNNVIINNQPVIERVQYIEKYRTIYVEKSQPKRYAKKISSPICLLGTIWVYVEDIGDFNSQSDAREVVAHLNATGAYGRNDWRIPTSAELAVMEQNADKIGLGDGIYIATSHCNGILRPVSTGITIAEKEKASKEEQKRMAEMERLRNAKRNENIQEQIYITNSGQGISDGNMLIWATRNVGASSEYDKGSVLSYYHASNKWRLPTSNEMHEFEKKSSFSQRVCNGYLKKIYVYANITLIGGRYLTSDGYYDLGTNDGISERKGYVRLVQNIEY